MAQPSHREQLLQGAVQCLRTKGYARTTARDIAAAAHGNLASIGYHFGSKEALLNEAIGRSCEEWTDRLGKAALAGSEASPFTKVAASWVAMVDSFEELRPILLGLFEAVAQSAWSPPLREQLAAHYRTSRDQVAQMVRDGLEDDLEEAGIDPHVVAAFLIAVCDGLVLQWLLDPDQTPTGEELTASLGAAVAQSLA